MVVCCGGDVAADMAEVVALQELEDAIVYKSLVAGGREERFEKAVVVETRAVVMRTRHGRRWL